MRTCLIVEVQPELPPQLKEVVVEAEDVCLPLPVLLLGTAVLAASL